MWTVITDACSEIDLDIECRMFHVDFETDVYMYNEVGEYFAGASVKACFHLSRVVRKPDLYICENKDADQLRGNREADQRLCFRYTDSTIPLLSKSEISSL